MNAPQQDIQLDRQLQAAIAAVRNKAFVGQELTSEEVELLGGPEVTVLVLGEHGCAIQRAGALQVSPSGWKLWHKLAPSAPSLPSAASLPWCTDAYESVRCLYEMFSYDFLPFSQWRHPNAALLPELDELAGWNVKTYQLWLWFDMYERQRGAPQTTLLRDAFCDLFDKASDSLRWSLEFQSKGVGSAAEVPADKKAEIDAAFGCEAPIELHLAMYQLQTVPASAYRGKKQELEGEQLRALTLCLLMGRKAAEDTFVPMQKCIRTFDVTRLGSWRWSKTMGAYERHLQRRHNNLLFAPQRRIVTITDVYEARQRDAEMHDTALTELRAISKELREEPLPPNWFAYLNEMRQRIEGLQKRTAAMDRCGDDLVAFAKNLRNYVVSMFRELLETSTHIDEAEALHARREAVFASDFVRQIKTIPPEEITASLLSEDLTTLRAIVEAVEREPVSRGLLDRIKPEVLDVVREARTAGHEIPGIEDKLRVLGASL